MKSSGSLRKFSGNFGNCSKQIFWELNDFLKVSQNLRKCSELFGNFRKSIRYWFFWKSSEVFENPRKIGRFDRNCSKRFLVAQKYLS